MAGDAITLVSGLPRSGTSMMMKMLNAGGKEVLTDNIRTADEDNPKGYFELEAVKQLAKDKDKQWLEDARGKVVKIISQILKELPNDYHYKVIFMRRKMDEILASQKQMLIRRGEPTASPKEDQILAGFFQKHLDQTISWLSEQPHFDVLYVHYNEILIEPEKYVDKINAFFGGSLDTERMKNVMDRSLHRQRA